jgi:hypothetical protein
VGTNILKISIKKFPFKEKEKEGGEGRSQLDGQWKVPMFGGPLKVPLFSGPFEGSIV